MSPISQWQSMKIYRKLRTNKILRLFAFFIYDSTAARTLSCFHSLSLSTLSLAHLLSLSLSGSWPLSICRALLLSPFSWLIEMHFLDACSSSMLFVFCFWPPQNDLLCCNSLVVCRFSRCCGHASPPHVGTAWATQLKADNVYYCRLPFQLIETYKGSPIARARQDFLQRLPCPVACHVPKVQIFLYFSMLFIATVFKCSAQSKVWTLLALLSLWALLVQKKIGEKVKLRCRRLPDTLIAVN